MKENGVECIKFSRRSRGYSSFRGEVGRIAENKLNRRFQVSIPNKVWVTDVTEFKIHDSNRKLYLSPIMDLFSSEIISFSLATSPTVKFTTDALDNALKKLPQEHQLTIHSDQGFHYQHIHWVDRLKKHKIEQSMSRRGNCIDNSPMENFFGLLKQEMYYGRIFKSYEELKREISEIIHKSVKDPRIPDFVSVTRVETSKDMKHAKVYISVLDNNADTKDLEAALKSATGFIKKEIAKGVKMRFIPELQFIMDHSIEYGMRMAKLIDDLKNAERE